MCNCGGIQACITQTQSTRNDHSHWCQKSSQNDQIYWPSQHCNGPHQIYLLCLTPPPPPKPFIQTGNNKLSFSLISKETGNPAFIKWICIIRLMNWRLQHWRLQDSWSSSPFLLNNVTNLYVFSSLFHLKNIAMSLLIWKWEELQCFAWMIWTLHFFASPKHWFALEVFELTTSFTVATTQVAT